MQDSGGPREHLQCFSHSKYCNGWRKSKQRTQEEWRREPIVKRALDELSQQGGSRSSGPTFRAYLAKEAEHWETMFEEFVAHPKRAKVRMARYRGKRSTQDSSATELLKGACQGTCDCELRHFTDHEVSEAVDMAAEESDVEMEEAWDLPDCMDTE
ncbi:hypothetical protein DUNSADRAFT_4631 [Dunaliella salina]|uniref:Uncharacterized protein n=1 Tax=Dunaliella salina TaxID=3046 RepID=A0ABQ7GRK5_DUNSA|nr:hypothetical protein DUNSADRAFT_4631 [Dunaliella salina]|eukprot:KAF5837240.1 hypothetical protein DUNSADRAFT_4631 [Dunaliella salina]